MDTTTENPFANEELRSTYGYFSGYQPKSIAQQVKILNGFFPNLGEANEKIAKQPLPPNAEGWFAIPRWHIMAGWPRSLQCQETIVYGEALQKILTQIKLSRGGRFFNCLKGEGEIASHNLRLVHKTTAAMEKLGRQQYAYDILVIPCQFGLLHRGRSVRRVWEVVEDTEFGLDPFSIACMLLTHPERLNDFEDLWINCPGGDYKLEGTQEFDHSLFFCITQEQLMTMDESINSFCCAGFGSASGFIR